MPNITCPFKKDKGYVTARRCHAPCGGWVVLYDRNKGFPVDGLPERSVTGRWILVHRPSLQWAGVSGGKDLAMKMLVACAKGEDPHGILPATLPEAAQPEALRSALPLPESVEKPKEIPHSGGSGEGRTCARADGEDKDKNGGDLPDPLAVQRALNEAFPASRIVEEFEAGLTATKTFVLRSKTKDGFEEQLAEAPDPATRIKYLAELTKFRIGNPLPREKVVEPKKITAAQLDTMIQTSPATRRALARKIQEAEERERLLKSQAADDETKAKNPQL